jgi:glycosyltransferase involved in cell wall biosynthesis
MPVLEAMKSGCPVITSNTSSLPEVVGDAAITINPYDKKALIQAISKLITDSGLRNSLIKKGFKQAEKFSWSKSAHKLLEVFKKC